jgi:EAL domain-containing protein (putative c-di-GMP-specific phosphodiesterase class I)
VLAAVAEPIACRGQDIVATASMGISVAPDDGTDVDTLVRNAETALNCAKRNGRNTFHFYSTNMNHELVERFEVETKLRRALDRDELRLYYQPLVDVRTGRRTGLEALVRWQHPDMGLVLPGEFIPVAEESELIHPLGTWVLRTASRQMVRWGVPWRLAVNISATQLSEPAFVDCVIDVLRETRLPPSQLELELTESGVLRDHPAIRAKLARLKQLGVRLAVDDFGTGYSALSYLRDFPLDTVKIDRSFVSSLESAERNGTLIAAMISMAHHLGLRVTGEGVETEAQLRFLAEHGCDEAQGFLLGRPQDASSYGVPPLRGD